MKNIALCFDRARATNATALADLLVCDRTQLVWSIGDVAAPGRRRFGAPPSPLSAARAEVAEAYRFLVEEWEDGDRVFLFGAGRGASCATALARLLGAVGVLNADLPGWTAEEFRSYVLATYVMPRTARDCTDWEHIGQLAGHLSGRGDVGIDVAFVGLWDRLTVPGQPHTSAAGPLNNVAAARHAVAIEGGAGGVGRQLLGDSSDRVQEVWFRGAHWDVAGGPGACRALAGIALDWVVEGAVAAGAAVRPCPERVAPCATDALAGSVRAMSFRKVPDDAAVHASVQSYVRAHPSYWRRLPARLVWADVDWVARSERLVSRPVPHTPALDAEMPALVAAS